MKDRELLWKDMNASAQETRGEGRAFQCLPPVMVYSIRHEHYIDIVCMWTLCINVWLCVYELVCGKQYINHK